jgi:hypothetical protein
MEIKYNFIELQKIKLRNIFLTSFMQRSVCNEVCNYKYIKNFLFWFKHGKFITNLYILDMILEFQTMKYITVDMELIY